MSSEPRCSLCSGQLAKEKGVVVAASLLSYTQAWVCTQCSAVFPIAVAHKSVLGQFEPLYTDGKRLVEKSS
jgi:hypothetical protein